MDNEEVIECLIEYRNFIYCYSPFDEDECREAFSRAIAVMREKIAREVTE